MFNPNDLDLLSAYLDDALSPEERAALETRLQSDEALRRELDRLRATVALVGTLPTLRAPRDFVLTPRMVRRPSIFTSAAFSAMSAAAAVVLLVVGVALFGIRAPGQTAQLANEVALLPTAGAVTATLLHEDTEAVPQALARMDEAAEAATLKSETAAPGADMFMAAPSDSVPAGTSVPPMLYAAQATETTSDLLSMQTSDGVLETEEQQRNAVSETAPSAMSDLAAGGAAAAAEAPLPAPTMLPSATASPKPSATFTASPAPTATASPTALPTQPPSPPPAAETASPDANTAGIALIILAVALGVVALVTTLLRRRT